MTLITLTGIGAFENTSIFESPEVLVFRSSVRKFKAYYRSAQLLSTQAKTKEEGLVPDHSSCSPPATYRKPQAPTIQALGPSLLASFASLCKSRLQRLGDLSSLLRSLGRKSPAHSMSVEVNLPYLVGEPANDT